MFLKSPYILEIYTKMDGYMDEMDGYIDEMK